MKKLTPAPAADSGTVQVRRISWQQLWKLRPDLRPANDNTAAERETDPRAKAA